MVLNPNNSDKVLELFKFKLGIKVFSYVIFKYIEQHILIVYCEPI
jgi:hypothetical protein